MVLLTLQNTSVQASSLEKLLVRYLVAACPRQIPGCDGMTTPQILQDYSQLAERGVVPGCSQLSRLHPELRPQLKRFFRKPTDQISL